MKSIFKLFKNKLLRRTLARFDPMTWEALHTRFAAEESAHSMNNPILNLAGIEHGTHGIDFFYGVTRK
jgi:hypothetical protein